LRLAAPDPSRHHRIEAQTKAGLRLPEADLPELGGGPHQELGGLMAGLWLSRPTGWPSGWHSETLEIEGLHTGNELVVLDALGIDAAGRKHPVPLARRGDRERPIVQAKPDD
jgi:hypothetical protein